MEMTNVSGGYMYLGGIVRAYVERAWNGYPVLSSSLRSCGLSNYYHVVRHTFSSVVSYLATIAATAILSSTDLNAGLYLSTLAKHMNQLLL